ncbi:MAG TPA: rhodanese-like domain-containing protein [Burkholderiales bacterium]|nr:rhodanese-like domain-containing protein [Burkholderiales bacterium]
MVRAADLRQHVLGVLFVFGILVALSNLPGGTRAHQVREISPQDAKALIDGGALVVDVRGRDQYDAHHIAGAIAVPLDELRASIPAEIAADQARNIVIYCGDGSTTGPAGTAVLNGAGFPNAVNLESGLQGWENAGYRVVSR